jgi:hypothetical protein
MCKATKKYLYATHSDWWSCSESYEWLLTGRSSMSHVKRRVVTNTFLNDVFETRKAASDSNTSYVLVDFASV